MLHLISSGDLDTGMIKRYICDSKDDFKELPIVKEGSTVIVVDTSEVYEINASGEWKFKHSLGVGGGGTPSCNAPHWEELKN